MKLLIIRHGDPDYERDSLTPKGWREAKSLAGRIAKLQVKQVYVSPLGRAKDTASLTLEKLGLKAIECQWLREFAPQIYRPDAKEKIITWDWLPKDWTGIDEFYHKQDWKNHSILKEGEVDKEYQWVTDSLDSLLAEHGYIRNGNCYEVEKANNDTIIFFCHFGLECVLLSHLLGVSPMVLWHGLCAAPSSVTTLITEERRKGIAYFRMSSFGDTSHLYAAGDEPSVSARFCECFENEEERHD